MMTRDCEHFRHFSTVLGTNSAKKTCRHKNRLQPMRRLMLLMLLLGCCASTSVIADETPNAQQARRIFNHTYDMVFGPQGSTLQYNVNIIGVMKVKGRIWYKGKKKRYEESRYLSWSDGVKYSRVDMKKKTVTLFDANNPQREKYESKFTFNPLDFDYYVEDGGTDFIVTLNAHKKAKCNIKHAKAIIDNMFSELEWNRVSVCTINDDKK